MHEKDMATLLAEISQCRICRDAPRYGKALPHEPSPVCVISRTARIAICGQAPGIRVHNTGLPFNDPSGDRLRQWLGVSREEFYDPARFAIIPMGFCFPGYDAHGSDLPPRRECRELWHDRIFAGMPQIELVIAIGQYAQAYHMGSRRKSSMTQTVLDWRASLENPEENGRIILPLPHPSWRNSGWLKRNPWFERELIPELQGLVQKLTNNGK
ncbi:uracil-DNA glycosylase family protein [Phyllobacterium phragmitis]|uniref:Uracil-DNA glycosylase family protein n=2 Tax=Phyllobacterium phragmitis TaxID=2670329 RepID=A0ABQ0H071_9HYPH